MQSKFSQFISASALSLALTGTAFAADEYGAQPGAQSDAMGQSSAMQDQQVNFSSLYKASGLQDLEVMGSNQEQIGTISEVLIGDDGNVSHVVVSEDGGVFGGGNNYLIPWDQLQIDAQQQTASLDVTSDQLSTEFSAFEEIPPTRLDQQQDQQMQPDQPMQPDEQPGAGDTMDSPEGSQMQ